MAAYPMSAAAAAVVAAGGSCLPPSGAFCNLPWMCPSQPPTPHPPHSAERLLQPSMSRREGGGGHLEEIVVPGSSHHMMALHNSSVGPSPYFPLDSPSLMYSYYLGFGNADVRRKNATRESTSTLKAWLYEHRKNPYPTKGEKIMLAIITKMTLTQVSTWFANARRRLKKENKGEWGLKDTNDVDEDDFEDDVAHSDGGIANASASDTSSPRCSPDLPRLLSPSDDPLASRSVASAAGSTSPMTNSDSAARTSDEVKNEGYGHSPSNSPPADIIKDSSSSSTSSSSSASSHPTPFCVPLASSHAVRNPLPSSDLDRLAPPTGDASKPGGIAGSAAPAKRKLWSIDDIVSPSHPADASRFQGESSNPGSHPPPTSGFPLHCGPLSDRTPPFRYGPYFVDGARFGREGFEPRASLYQWVTTKGGDVGGLEGEVRRAFEAPSSEFKEQAYRNGFFNRPPGLSVAGFTSENRHDYPTPDVYKTENRILKIEDDCHRTTS